MNRPNTGLDGRIAITLMVLAVVASLPTLAVAFLGHAAGGDEASALLNHGGGIAVVIAALAFFTKSGSKKPDAAGQ